MAVADVVVLGLTIRATLAIFGSTRSRLENLLTVDRDRSHADARRMASLSGATGYSVCADGRIGDRGSFKLASDLDGGDGLSFSARFRSAPSAGSWCLRRPRSNSPFHGWRARSRKPASSHCSPDTSQRIGSRPINSAKCRQLKSSSLALRRIRTRARFSALPERLPAVDPTRSRFATSRLRATRQHRRAHRAHRFFRLERRASPKRRSDVANTLGGCSTIMPFSRGPKPSAHHSHNFVLKIDLITRRIHANRVEAESVRRAGAAFSSTRISRTAFSLGARRGRAAKNCRRSVSFAESGDRSESTAGCGRICSRYFSRRNIRHSRFAQSHFQS